MIPFIEPDMVVHRYIHDGIIVNLFIHGIHGRKSTVSIGTVSIRQHVVEAPVNNRTTIWTSPADHWRYKFDLVLDGATRLARIVAIWTGRLVFVSSLFGGSIGNGLVV